MVASRSYTQAYTGRQNDVARFHDITVSNHLELCSQREGEKEYDQRRAPSALQFYTLIIFGVRTNGRIQ